MAVMVPYLHGVHTGMPRHIAGRRQSAMTATVNHACTAVLQRRRVDRPPYVV